MRLRDRLFGAAFAVLMLATPAFSQIGTPGLTTPAFSGGNITAPILGENGSQTAPTYSFKNNSGGGLWSGSGVVYLGAYSDGTNYAKCDFWAGDVVQCRSLAGASNDTKWALDPAGAQFSLTGTFGGTNTFSVTGSVGGKGTKIQSTDGTETVSVDANFDKGVVLLTFGSKPTCNVNARGAIWYTQGGAGVADAYEVCLKNAADAYNWVALATP